MKLRIKPTSALSSIGAFALLAPTFAHPGHEPDDLLHALAHELASPRGILAIIILCIAAGLWLYARSQRK
jgi:hypothetical protein